MLEFVQAFRWFATESTEAERAPDAGVDEAHPCLNECNDANPLFFDILPSPPPLFVIYVLMPIDSFLCHTSFLQINCDGAREIIGMSHLVVGYRPLFAVTYITTNLVVLKAQIKKCRKLVSHTTMRAP